MFTRPSLSSALCIPSSTSGVHPGTAALRAEAAGGGGGGGPVGVF